MPRERGSDSEVPPIRCSRQLTINGELFACSHRTAKLTGSDSLAFATIRADVGRTTLDVPASSTNCSFITHVEVRRGTAVIGTSEAAVGFNISIGTSQGRSSEADESERGDKGFHELTINGFSVRHAAILVANLNSHDNSK
jgi:hypothetical protein